MAAERPTPTGPLSPDLTIVESRVYRGPNYWSYEKAIHLVVEHLLMLVSNNDASIELRRPTPKLVYHRAKLDRFRARAHDHHHAYHGFASSLPRPSAQ